MEKDDIPLSEILNPNSKFPRKTRVELLYPALVELKTEGEATLYFKRCVDVLIRSTGLSKVHAREFLLVEFLGNVPEEGGEIGRQCEKQARDAAPIKKLFEPIKQAFIDENKKIRGNPARLREECKRIIMQECPELDSEKTEQWIKDFEDQVKKIREENGSNPERATTAVSVLSGDHVELLVPEAKDHEDGDTKYNRKDSVKYIQKFNRIAIMLEALVGETRSVKKMLSIDGEIGTGDIDLYPVSAFAPSVDIVEGNVSAAAPHQFPKYPTS